jgi:hypothetical protein
VSFGLILGVGVAAIALGVLMIVFRVPLAKFNNRFAFRWLGSTPTSLIFAGSFFALLGLIFTGISFTLI